MPILNMVWWWKKWGNIWEPLNLTVTTSWLDATITWEDNEIWTIPPTTFQKSELVRKIGSAPTSPSDWVLVVTETVKDTYKTTWYVDQWLTDWETYYYRVFSYSDLGGISYCDAVSVTPSGSWWQPWANTLFYCNIDNSDTTTTIHDKSWNNRDLTWHGTWAYITDTDAWKVADFDWASYASLGGYINPWGNAYTMIIRGKYSTSWMYVSQWSGSSVIPSIAILPSHFIYKNPAAAGSWINFSPTQPSSTWAMLVWVRDGSSIKIYYNGQLNDSKTDNNITVDWASWWYFELWVNRDQYDFLAGQIKTVIYENKAWTAQEVSDYFDQTKWDYWIS